MDKTDAKTAMEELSMVLIYLSHFTRRDRFTDSDDKYAWKGYDFDILNQLDEKDYINRALIGQNPCILQRKAKQRPRRLWKNIMWQTGKIMFIISEMVYYRCSRTNISEYEIICNL